MKYQVEFDDGTLWIDDASNAGAAASRAIRETYIDREVPVPKCLHLTVMERSGGSIIMPAQEATA